MWFEMAKRTRIWLTQVRIQIWKFYRLKRYHFAMSFFELFFSSLLFLILLFIKFANSLKYSNPIDFQEIYLPSAGMSIWLQSLLCHLYRHSWDSAPENTYNDSLHAFKPLCPYENSRSFDCFIDWYESHGVNYNSSAEVLREVCGAIPESSKYTTLSKQKQFHADNRQTHEKSPLNGSMMATNNCENVLRIVFPQVPSVRPSSSHNKPPDMLTALLHGSVLYTPNDTRANRIVEEIKEYNFGPFINQKTKLDGSNRTVPADVLQFFECMVPRFQAIDDEDHLLEMAQKLDAQSNLIAAVVFNFNNDSGDLPSYLNYTIRVNSHFIDPKVYVEPLSYSPHQPESNTYLFLAVQDMVDNAFMRLSSADGNSDSRFAVTLQQLPQSCQVIYDHFSKTLKELLPFYLPLAFFAPFVSLVANIVEEKEDHMKEYLLVMSMDKFNYWIAWYINGLLWCLFIFSPSFIFLGLALKGYADFSLVLFFTLLYITSAMSQALLLSCFFDSSTAAGQVTPLLYFLFILLDIDAESWTLLALISLVPQIGFVKAIKMITNLQHRGKMATWSDITLDLGGGQSLFLIMVFLCLDAGIYALLALYVDSVYPGTHGVGKGWCFCLKNVADSKTKPINLQKKSWPLSETVTEQKARTTPDVPSRGAETNAFPGFPETTTATAGINGNNSLHHIARGLNARVETPVDVRVTACGVELRGVTKVFKSSTGSIAAVKNLTLQIPPNEISVMLGQNGAGKTTIFSMIIGTLAVSSGEIFVQGRKVSSNTSEVRKLIGFCPQENTLFRNLTVQEHIMFFSALKTGEYPSQAEISEIVSRTNLQEFKEVPVKKLSGGNKRKLSVSLAFCGSAQVILLDEPTSGLDPSSRQAIWKLLEKIKKGKTVLMSTHYMDEADEMGDKVAIIDSGVLKAFDTPMGLKQKIAKFYRLVISTDESNMPWVNEIIRKIYAEDLGVSTGSAEVEFILPDKDDKDAKKLINLVKALEEKPNIDFGLMPSTMEDAFLASIGRKTEGNNARKLQQLLLLPTSESRLSKWKQQARALIVKRFYRITRDYWGFCLNFCAPLIFISFLINFIILGTKLQFSGFKVVENYPVQVMSPLLFENHGKSLQFPYSRLFKNDVGWFEASLTNPTGLGSMCHSKTEYHVGEILCQAAPTTEDITRVQETPIVTTSCDCCTCEGGTRMCDDDKSLKYASSFPTLKLASGEMLVNVSGQSMRQYFLDTDILMFKTRFAGLEVSSTPFTFVDYFLRIWYDGRASNSGPAYLNAVNNNLLNSRCPDGKACGISTLSHPLPPMVVDGFFQKYFNSFPALLMSYSILYAVTVASTSWVVPYSKENSSKFKLQEYLAGLSPITYWSVGLSGEIFIYLIFCASLLIIVTTFSVKPYAESDLRGPFASLIIVFGISNILLSGYLSLYVKKATSLGRINGLLCLFAYIFCWITIGITIESEKSKGTGNSAEVITAIFMLLPHYCLGMGLLKLSDPRLLASNMVVGDEVNWSDWSHLGKYYFTMLLSGTLGFFLLIILEFHCENHFRENVSISDSIDNALDVKDLGKIYHQSCGGQNRLAVDGVSFGVSQNSCFGLLGVNGAGKTTVMKMLTGQTASTGGTIVMRSRGANAPKLGYCPQTDTHDPLLTPAEMFTFHCRLQKYPEKDISGIVSNLLDMLDLSGYKDTTCKILSGGTNRRLSAGIAFLGAPQIVLLDEPSTGLDPVARRKVWELVKNPAHSSQCFILVSHMMEECEALCDNLGIMIKGKFECMGSPQYLKNKFGNNKYLITVDKLVLGDAEVLMKWIQKNFPTAHQEEEASSTVKFSVTLTDVPLSYIFTTLKQLQPVQGSPRTCYTVSQVTLDDVFLTVANNSKAANSIPM